MVLSTYIALNLALHLPINSKLQDKLVMLLQVRVQICYIVDIQFLSIITFHTQKSY